VDTIFEIGGQDSKFISLVDGAIVDFEMNKACAAGTGSFLEEQAEKLDVAVKSGFAELAFSSANPARLGERCTVFMENSLMALLQKGVPRNDLFAGLAYSIVQNYINRVVAGRPIGTNVFFQGGVAFNKSVVAAFEKNLGRTVTVPPNHDVTGAIGMALIALRQRLAAGREGSAFKGFDAAQRPYAISSFACGGCANLCEINRVAVEGEGRPLLYGGRCEKHEVARKRATGARAGGPRGRGSASRTSSTSTSSSPTGRPSSTNSASTSTSRRRRTGRSWTSASKACSPRRATRSRWRSGTSAT